MPLPDDFSAAAHLIDTLTVAHNQIVESVFVGVEQDSIGTPEESLLTACMMAEDDTIDMQLMRLFLFYFVLEGKLPTPVYAIPTPDYDSEVKYRPQIKLTFLEDPNATLAEFKLQRRRFTHTFRLMNYTPATMSPVIATEYASTIKAELGEGGLGITYETGQFKCLYKDTINGMDLRMNCVSQAEGERLAELICTVAGTSFNAQNFTFIQKNPPPPVTMVEIYGKERPSARKLPTTVARFIKAELLLSGVGKGITLYDRFKPFSGLAQAA